MEISTILIVVTATLFAYIFHKHFIKIYDYWPTRGVPCVGGALPFFGNTLSIYLLRKDIHSFSEDIYKAHRNRSIVGFYQNRKPNLLIRDPAIVNTVLTSSFSNFHENFFSVDPVLDPLFAISPLFVNGDLWKERRGYLSNALSGKKLKSLCPIVTGVCEKFTKYLDDNLTKSNGFYEVETKDLFTRFTGEVVANVGFGVEGEFFSNVSHKNSFRNIVHKSLDHVFVNTIDFMLVFFAPMLNKIIRNSFFPRRLDAYFKRLIALRTNDAVVRDDFLQFMLDARKHNEGNIDADDITSSLATFFLDAYETSAVTLVFFAYQVAANWDVQDKIRNEVNDVLKRHGGDITYESLGEMTYMNQALNESMRITQAFGILVKKCVERCKIVGNDGIECIVEPGTDLIIPVEFLQNDPKYWKNPEIYKPERFDAEHRKNRPKGVFLPFSEGPRICVGMAFATMQIKAAMATMLRRYSLEVSPKTKLPLQFEQSPLKAVKGGLWIKFKPL